MEKWMEKWMNEYKANESHQEKLVTSQRVCMLVKTTLQGLIAQYQENDLVLKELNLLENGDDIYRQVGPTLLQVPLDEAKTSVQQRMDRFKTEIEKLTKQHQEKQKEQEKLKEKATAVQSKMQEIESSA